MLFDHLAGISGEVYSVGVFRGGASYLLLAKWALCAPLVNMPSLSIPIFSRFSLTLRVAFSTPLCQRCLGSMIFAKEWLDRDCYMTTVCGPLWKYWSILYFQIWKTFTSIFLCALSPSSSRIAWLIHYIITGNPLHSDSNKWTALCRWRKAVSQGTMGNVYSRNKANTFTRVWTLQTIKGESQLNLQQQRFSSSD